MKKMLLAVSCLLLAVSGCATQSFVQQEIRKVEHRVGTNEIRIVKLENQTADIQEESQIALVMANRALWKAENVEKVQFEVLEEKELLFAFDRYELNLTAKSLLDSLGASLSDDPSLKLTIEGHTDNIASNIYNLNLGRRRAEEAKRYLVEKLGVGAYRISCLSFGESTPKAPNDNSEQRTVNRRAVLRVWKPL